MDNKKKCDICGLPSQNLIDFFGGIEHQNKILNVCKECKRIWSEYDYLAYNNEK